MLLLLLLLLLMLLLLSPSILKPAPVGPVPEEGGEEGKGGMYSSAIQPGWVLDALK
jgi:hypothetical protein